MHQERGRTPEQIRPGQFYFLSHPGSDLFSGYGLTTQAGRQDRLAGLLMVDRPHPVDPAWLAEVKARYGAYQLVPMTATGEQGLLTQMRIQPDSVSLLQRSPHPLARELRQALTPFLAAPPASANRRRAKRQYPHQP